MIASLVLTMGLVVGNALAGHYGNGCAGIASTCGTAPCFGTGGTPVNIFTGEAMTISGKVTDIGIYGQGLMKVNTASDKGEITVYGIGPVFYWNQVEVARPVVGDMVTVNGYNVTLADGSVRYIAASVVMGENEVALRDATTGAPLWWKQGQGCAGAAGCGRGMGRGTGKGMGTGGNPNCPYLQNSGTNTSL